MARRPGVWLHGRRGMFFTTIDSRQIPLDVPGPDTPANRAAAEEVLRRLLEGSAGRSEPKPGHDPVSVSDAVASFLAARELDVARGDLRAETLASYRSAAAPFALALGARPLSSLTAADVEGWAFRPGWGRVTRRNYLGIVARVLRDAGRPLRVRRPPPESRGAECVLTDEQFARVLARLRECRTPNDLPDLLELLRASGARPSEVSGLTVEAVDWPNKLARLTKHKTRGKTGKVRVIHFNSDAMAVLERQRAKYGSGLLFRNRHGRVYSPTRIADRLTRASRHLGFRAIAYGLGRHSFATEALARGVPSAVVAELLGHTGTAMLTHHYAHLGERAAELKDAAEKVSRGPSPVRPG
jgi:integrase